MAKRTIASFSRGNAASLVSAVGNLFRGLIKALWHPYRPEMHYMRGRGPKAARKRPEAGDESAWA